MANLPRPILVASKFERRAAQQSFFVANLLQTTLAPVGAVQAPFSQLDWSNPIRLKVSMSRHFLEATSYYTPPPIVPIDYPNPALKRKVQCPDLVPNLVLNTLYTPPPVPFIRFEWQNPVLKRRLRQDSIVYSYFGQLAAVPALLGQLPNIRTALNSGTHQYDLGFYFSGAVSYSISPSIEAGWGFNTSAGLLTIDTDDANTFGPYTVTATNPNGNTLSNTFTVQVSVSSGGGGLDLDLDLNI